MATARENRRRIDAMMSDATREIEPAHLIGYTGSGKRIYQSFVGWRPVAQMSDGSYRDSAGYRLNRDGDLVI